MTTEKPMQFTPGPLRSVRFLVFAGNRITADTSEITATAHGGTPEEGIANAKLYAAAPDLLRVAEIEQTLQMRGYSQAVARELGPEATDAYLSAGAPGLNNWRRERREAAIRKATQERE